MVPYIYLCTMIQCGRQSSRLGRASVNSTCPEAASAMPFCREDPCLLPNIRARSREMVAGLPFAVSLHER